MLRELERNILPFWLALEDPEHGGHHGRVDIAGRIDRRAPKFAVYAARLLWTFSAAGEALGRADCLVQAERARRFLLDRMLDPAQGGLYWSVSFDGRPRAAEKHVYAQAFGIYGLSAHAAATGDAESLEAAEALFRLVETRCRRAPGLYAEAFDLAWNPVRNYRLDPEGSLEGFTANAHLHLIEAYSALAQASPAPAPRVALRALLERFLGDFLASDSSHCHAFLDPQLKPRPNPPAFGHDIEASWIIEAAGETLEDPGLRPRLSEAAAALAAHAVQAQEPDGGWNDAGRDSAGPRLGWVQAEAILGLVRAARRGGLPDALERAQATWRFVVRHLSDRSGGDWFEGVDRQGRPDSKRPKAGPWKDPYHQARACLEVARLARLQGSETIATRSR